jgi:hypothetical protein
MTMPIAEPDGIPMLQIWSMADSSMSRSEGSLQIWRDRFRFEPILVPRNDDARRLRDIGRILSSPNFGEPYRSRVSLSANLAASPNLDRVVENSTWPKGRNPWLPKSGQPYRSRVSGCCRSGRRWRCHLTRRGRCDAQNKIADRGFCFRCDRAH